MTASPFQFTHGDLLKRGEQLQNASNAAAFFADVVRETDFDYLFPELARDSESLLPVDDTTIENLKKLGAAIIDQDDPPEANSIIPPVYTYWGQFIDHNITAQTDRQTVIPTPPTLKTDITVPFQPQKPDVVIADLKNARRPILDLDSVYGDGPTDPVSAIFYQPEDQDPVKLKIGQNATKMSDGTLVLQGSIKEIPPEDDLMRDLPRGEQPDEALKRLAIIADSRNDENLIVAQLHTAFLRFHNAVVDWVRTNEPENATDNQVLFKRAQTLVIWHYQWLVVNDFLQTVTVAGTVDSILNDGLKFYEPRDGKLFMPLEFSVAAYRFGHSMVRAAYNFNRNFSEKGKGGVTDATFKLLFAFTGKHQIGGKPEGPGSHDTLPFSWIIEWDGFDGAPDDSFIDKDKASQRNRASARKIDTHLAPPLKDLINEDMKEPLKHLAKRNLLRGYLYSIPTGQSLAQRLGIPLLTPEELKQGNSEAFNTAIEPFLEKTPAWFYMLKEAEVRANGDSLGEVGSRIVAETLLGLIINDPDSYLNQPDPGSPWDPSQGVNLPDGSEIRTIGDLLKFAGVLLSLPPTGPN